MFTKISLPLIPTDEENGFPTDESIQDAFRGLGLQLARKFDAKGEKETEICLNRIEPKGKVVPIGSTLHYRELSIQNAPKDTPEAVLRELTKYSIFFGAINHDEAFVYVTRVNWGEISIFVYQPDLTRCQRGSEKLLSRLLTTNVVNVADSASHPVLISSTRAGAQITRGLISNEKVRHVAASHPVEIGIALFALLASALVLGVDSLFAPSADANGNVVDPLGQIGRSITTAMWPTLLIASLTSAVTLLIHYWRTPRTFIRWDG